LTFVAVFNEAPREIKRQTWGRSPLQEAAYNRDESEVRSSGDTGDRTADDATAGSWRGDLGGVRVAGRDVCRTCGNVFVVAVVGDSGGLHCEVAFRKGGGW
jgi:hypothetical protein